jgi:hypothetical protein
MANHQPKGDVFMRKIARRGGLASGETRRLKRVQRLLTGFPCEELGIAVPGTINDPRLAAVLEMWELTGRRYTFEQIVEVLRPVDHRGGSHDNDWRCPSCHHFNSEKRRAGAKCKSVAPANGRLTRKALRERAEEHKTAAILGKFGLLRPPSSLL